MVLSANRAVSTDHLLGLLWPGVEADKSLPRLRVMVSRLRRALPGLAVESCRGGYRLVADITAVDLLQFEALARRAEQGDSSAVTDALALWRGEPFHGLPADHRVRRARQRLIRTREHLVASLAGSTPDLRMRHRAAVSAEPGPGWVTRRDLLRRLPPPGGVSLIALTAPAGFGKSAVVRQWLEAHQSFNLELKVEDLPTPRYVKEAIRQQLPGGGIGPVGFPLESLADAMADIGSPTALVFDDAHRATQSVASLIEELIWVTPPSVTVVIASQWALPFRTAKLDATGEVRAFGPDDLAFTPTEELKAIRLASAMSLPGGYARRLRQLTGGAPGPTMRLATQIAQVDPRELSTWEPATVGRTGLFSDLPRSTLDVLTATSHMDVVEPELVAELCPRLEAKAELDNCARKYLLLSPRDDGGYVHLPKVATALRGNSARLDPDRWRKTRLHTARWYRQRQDPIRALNHALEAGSDELVTAWLSDGMEAALRDGNGAVLARWLGSAFPFEKIEGPDRSLIYLTRALLGSRWLELDLEDGDWLGDIDPAVRDVILAIQSCRQGDMHSALRTLDETESQNGRAREQRNPPLDLDLVEELRRLLHSYCHLMLGDFSDAKPRTDPPRSHAIWPWLHAWDAGQRSLSAYLARSARSARAMLPPARRWVEHLDPSWPTLTNGVFALMSVMLGGNSPASHDRPGEIREMVDRIDRKGDRPLGVAARYLQHRNLAVLGQQEMAENALARADEIKREFGEVPMLVDLRRKVSSTGSSHSEAIANLTESERAVLRYLDSGLTLEAIANSMFLSIHTVRSHVRSIYRQLGVRRRPELIRILRSV